MRIRKSWVAVGAAAALGVGGTTTAASALNDRGELSTTAGAIDLPGGTSPGTSPGGTSLGGASTATVDDSPESADSPAESAVESSGSPFDSPDDPGYVAPAADPAVAGAAGALASSDSQAPAPVAPAPPAPAAPRQAPAPAPVYVDDSADAPGVFSAQSAESADSP